MPGPNAKRSNESQSLFAVSSSRVVTPVGEIAAAILIEGEKIRDVVGPADVPPNVPVTDFGDLVISPGVVDAHVHVNEPGRTEWEGFASATASAAAGGVTTIVDMPLNSSPVTTTACALQAKQSAAVSKCLVHVGFYGGLVPGNESELAGLVEAGVLGIKAFMCDSGLDEFPASGESELRAALEFLKPLGVPLLVHAEIVNSQLIPLASDPRSYLEYAASRPPQFELAAIEMLIRLCREFKSPIHIVHLATARALPQIEAAKKQGLPLSVETCPHYLYFSDEQIENGQTSYKCAPPIRDENNRQALCGAVSSGLIETIGSDHSPCPPEMKLLDTGEFSKAWGGIAGLQLTLPVTWTVGKEFGWTTSMIAERLSQRPAEIFGMGNRKGRIEAGFDADLVVWDPEKEFLVRGKELFHRHDVTPYDGRQLAAVVNQTYIGGNLVYDAGRLSGDKAFGKQLKRGVQISVGGSVEIAKMLSALSPQQLSGKLEICCASQAWIDRMAAGGNFQSDLDVISRAEEAWQGVGEHDLLEAFSAHPKIGDIESLREKYTNTKVIAGGEQAGVDSADEATLQRLAAANDEYFEKFGFIFIVCASGKSASEMLEILERRLQNDRGTELANAAAEQLKITKIRLRKLIA